LFARLDTGFERTVWTQRRIPFDRVGKAVKLDEVDPLNAHSLK
jgi:hypothetical protein